ncbi:MAG: DUF58 domain-containing protein [Burkholderiaceae bacterium]
MLAASSPLRARFDRWLFRAVAPEAGEVFLNQRRVFILPTRAGLAFALMLTLLFVGSINYALSLGFALTFLIAACAVIDMHLAFRNLAHLHLAPGRAQPVFAREHAQIELRLINRRRHDRYAIRVGFAGGGLGNVEQTVDVPAESVGLALLSLPAIERGWLAAPRVRLQTRFPLGLLRAWSYWYPDLRILVYPQPEPDAPPLPVAGGGDEGNGDGGEEDFAGIRAYQPGDSLKHLAWRQIARLDDAAGGTLLTKHFAGSGGVTLCLDYDRLPRTMNAERRLSRMTRWVLDAEARGLPYAFRLGATAFDAGLGPAHRHACLRALALHEGG